jgi:hypothetical protein
MRRGNLIVALLGISLLLASIACGGDSGELSEAEYFLRMDAIDKSLDQERDVIFATADLSAVEGADRLVTTTDNAKDQYQEIDPPDSLKDAHDAVIEAIDEFGDAIDGAANDASGDALFSDLFENEDVAAADEDLRNAYCAVQEEADRRGIAADVGCN